MKTYRILENGEQIWHGLAHNPDDAIERCFDDELPGAMCRYTLQEYRMIKLSKSNKGMGWHTHMRDARFDHDYSL
jgi:hypothetical protein